MKTLATALALFLMPALAAGANPTPSGGIVCDAVNGQLTITAGGQDTDSDLVRVQAWAQRHSTQTCEDADPTETLVIDQTFPATMTKSLSAMRSCVNGFYYSVRVKVTDATGLTGEQVFGCCQCQGSTTVSTPLDSPWMVASLAAVLIGGASMALKKKARVV